MFAKFATVKIAKDLNPLTKNNFQQVLNLKTLLVCTNMMRNDCLDWDLNPGPLDHRAEVLPTELHTHLDIMGKSLSLVANHLVCEYREKTTPSRIFMPCNLSSCRVLYDKFYLYFCE